jgi:hypothetical protein
MPEIDGQYLFLASEPGSNTLGKPLALTPEDAFDKRWAFFVEYYPTEAETYFSSVKPPIEEKSEVPQFVDVGGVLLDIQADPDAFKTGGSKIYYYKSPNNYVFTALVGPV